MAIRRPSPGRALGTGGTINWGIFKRHFWGELLRHQHGAVVRAERGVDLGGLRDVLRAVKGGDMIAVAAGVKVLVATKPVDFRNYAECTIMLSLRW